MTLRLLLLILFLSLISCSSYAQNLSFWEKLESPTSQLLNRIFFLDSTTGWTAGDSGTILGTTNGGMNWEYLYGAADTYILDLFFLDKQHGWVLYWDLIPPQESRILKTTNGGADWATFQCPGENPFFNAVCFIDSMTGFLAGRSIFKTTNGGENWYETYLYDVDTIPPDLAGLPKTELVFTDKVNGYASGGFRDVAGVMWKTSDIGESWGATGISADEIFDFHVFDSLSVKSLAGDPEGFFPILYISTTNSGSTWNTSELGSYGLVNAVSFRTANEGWGLSGSVFLISTDSGNNWKEYPMPDSITLLDIVFTDSLTGYASGSGGSIYKYITPPLTDIERNTSVIPEEFSLSQNYPNPFNPVTNIHFSVPQDAGIIKVLIYNMLGELTAVLVNSYLAPGSYKYQWDASRLPSGIYFCKLTSETFTSVVKMILMK
jgi:photosystem II stability/assembly factor-like uncharacterized protein